MDNNQLNLQEQDYINFKNLLGYFVAHLEHNANTTPSTRKLKLSDHLQAKLNGNTFVVQGAYNNINLQNNISQWSLYPMGRMSITVCSSFGDNWTTKASYIQWQNTGLNIHANWDETGKKILSLCFYKYKGSGKRELSEDQFFTVKDLGLYDEGLSEKLKTMMNGYAEQKIKESYKELVSSLKLHKNIILTGAPGTGKTFLAEKIAKELTKDGGLYKKIQFHPSYDYTDFVEGLRPENNGKDISFVYKQGSFVDFCTRAIINNNDCVFIIDEINRGELNKIFGELFSCIEEGYRGKEHRVDTQYKNVVSQKIILDGEEVDNPFYNDGFYVPENVYIIGTMNDIDRSVESIDFALRRRFVWKNIGWDFSLYDMMKNIGYDKSVVLCCFRNLNNKITEDLGESYCIGGSYIKKLEGINYSSLHEALEELWNNSIFSVINEYWRGQSDSPNEKLDEYRDVFLKFAKS